MKKILTMLAIVILITKLSTNAANALVTQGENNIIVSDTIVSNSAVVNPSPTNTYVRVWFLTYSHYNNDYRHDERVVNIRANSTTFDWSPNIINSALGVPVGHVDYNTRNSWQLGRWTDRNHPIVEGGIWRFPKYWYDAPSNLIGTQYYNATGYFHYFPATSSSYFRTLNNYLSSCTVALAPKVLPVYSLTATVNFGTPLTYPKNVVIPNLTRHFPNHKNFTFSNVDFCPTNLFLNCVPSGATYDSVFKGDVIVQASPGIYCSVGSIESLSFLYV